MNFKYIVGGIAFFGGLSGMALADNAADADTLAARLAPVGRLCLQGQECQRSETRPAAPASTPDAPDPAAMAQYDGEALYTQASCGACHAAGIAGAPATGDGTAWTARLAKGTDTLYASAINGIGAMPPKGGRFNFSDDEIKAIVDYMIDEVE